MDLGCYFVSNNMALGIVGKLVIMLISSCDSGLSFFKVRAIVEGAVLQKTDTPKRVLSEPKMTCLHLNNYFKI